MDSTKSVCVVGSIVLQSVETPYGKTENAMGGSAVYFTLASRIFVPVKLVSVIGKDFPREYMQILDKPGVDLKGVQRSGEKSFTWSVLYDENMRDRKTLNLKLHDFAGFEPGIPPDYRKVGYVFLAASAPFTQTTILSQIPDPIFVLLDTVDFWIETAYSDLQDLMRLVDAIIINDSEARMFSGQSNIISAARYILGLGPKVVIVKKGEKGSTILWSDKLFSVPAYPCEVVKDPTGAGDCFAGGVMSYIAKTGRTDIVALKTAMVLGTIIASFCVEDFGLRRLEDLSLRQIKTRLSKYMDFLSSDTASNFSAGDLLSILHD